MKRVQLSALLALILFSSPAQSLEKHIETKINVSRGELETRAYLSEQVQIHGTVLIRTPYLTLDSYADRIHFWSSRGFHVVVQSIAGTGRSFGEFKYLSTDEIDDAQKTLTWISRQAFSNGKVLLYGESYDGFLALAGALTRHPSITAVVAASAPTDPKRDSFSSGGMIDLELLKYYLDLPSNQLMSKRIFKRKVKELQQRKAPLDQYDDFFREGGIPDWDRLVRESFQMNFVERGVYEKLHEIKVPVLFTAGEHRDQDATDALHAFSRRKSLFQNDEVRCATKLALGPWFHGNQEELSRKVVHRFVEAVFTETLQCQFQHQIEYITNINSVRIGTHLHPEIFEKFSDSFDIHQVEFGFFYDTDSVDPRGLIPLPHICEPWKAISPGLERPFVRIPIEEDLRLAGPIEARISAIAQTEGVIGLSMDILVNWSSLDDKYNMHRTRQMVRGKNSEAVSIQFRSPYLSLELKKGDELILSFQRSHSAMNQCLGEDILWLLDETHPLEISFFFEKRPKP